VRQSTIIMKNSAALMGGRLYHSVLNLVAVALIARYLKLEGFGQYGFIMAVCTIFMVVTDMGINTICMREMSRDVSGANDIFWAACFLKSVLSLLTFGCIAVIMNLLTHDKQIVSATYIAAVAVIVFFLGDVFSALFVAFEKMGYMALLAIVQATTYLAFVVLFIRLDLGLHGIFGALLFSYIARILCGIVITYRKFFKPWPRWNLSLCLYLLKEAYPIGINRVLRKISFRIDTILIKTIRSAAEVGIFHGAYRIILVLTLIPQSINQALFPMISRLATESKASLSNLLERSFKMLLIMVIPSVATLVLFSKDLILLILGKSFLEAGSALMAFSFIWGMMFFNDLFVRFLNGCNEQVMATKAVAFCLTVNVCADVALIYWFGYLGAIIATLLAEISLFVWAYHYLSKHVALIHWRRVVFKPLLAGIPMAIGMYALNPVSHILAASSGMGAFFLAIFLLQALDREETELIKENLQKMRHRFGYLTAR
jgi:O-antigen/teichoic acid export membrane protein